MKTSFTPAEYKDEIDFQSVQVWSLTSELSEPALNWQPTPGSWSIAQCVDHLVLTNDAVLAAIRATVENNRDDLKPRTRPIQAAGWLSRKFVQNIGPDAGTKYKAPKKIVPVSQLSAGTVTRFLELQKSLEKFMAEFGEADLGALRYPNPLLPVLRWTVDTGLLILIVHNARHLQQAERVRGSETFPG